MPVTQLIGGAVEFSRILLVVHTSICSFYATWYVAEVAGGGGCERIETYSSNSESIYFYLEVFNSSLCILVLWCQVHMYQGLFISQS